MKRALLALLLIAPPAFGQVTPVVPAASTDAKAVITLPNGNLVPKTWPLGTTLKLSAKNSVVGGLPKSFRWEIEPAWIDQHSIRSADGSEIDVSTGRNPKSITIAVDVAKGDTVDRTTLSIDFVIDPDEPGVVPTPSPLPPAPPDDPAPASPLQGAGKDYAAADVRAMAATWEESATMLAAGTPLADITRSFGPRWQARRTPAFKTAGDAFAAISPAGTEPSGASKDALVAAWKDFAVGLRLGVK